MLLRLIRDRLDPWLARADPDAPKPAEVVEISISASGRTLPARLYRPDDDSRDLLVFFHGGGLVSSNLDTHDAVCRRLCVGAGINVLSVDYRLAPEAMWPAAWDDAETAATWSRTEGGMPFAPSRLFLGGDSAGALLAVSVARRWLRMERRAADGLIFFYPMLGLDPASDDPRAFRHSRRWLRRVVVGKGRAGDPVDLAPAWFDATALPPVFVASGGRDPVRRDAERLMSALGGREGDHHHLEPKATHGWLNLAGALPRAAAQAEGTVQALRSFLIRTET